MDATATPEPAPGAPDRELERYQRRQRRRAIVGWSSACLVVALIVLGGVFGEGRREHPAATSAEPLAGWEMSSSQYEQIHRGEAEAAVLGRLDSPGLPEAEVRDPTLLGLFPPPPPASTCGFWKLSDAPDHLVRLCFSEARRVLLQKVVRAPDESGVQTTLA